MINMKTLRNLLLIVLAICGTCVASAEASHCGRFHHGHRGHGYLGH